MARDERAQRARKVELRRAHASIPQGAFVIRGPDGKPQSTVLGAVSFSTEGLGLAPGNPLGLIQASETPEEGALLSQWFDMLWTSLPVDPSNRAALIDELENLAAHTGPLRVYSLILLHLFRDCGEELDEERIVKSATGIRNTVWKKLFRFLRDGVIGAIDKLNRFGGCIIADSVGLGKPFEALAIIKYHELRNDRVLVLCPKRLRDNWTLYKANDRGISSPPTGSIIVNGLVVLLAVLISALRSPGGAESGFLSIRRQR